MGENPPTRSDGIAIFAGRNGRVCTIGDIVAAAHFRGELEEPWQRLQRGLAADESAAERDMEIDDDAVQERSDEFRSNRDLITAEETERWLEARGLTLDDFNDHFIRSYWSDLLGDKVQVDETNYVEAPGDVQDLLKAEVLMSGEFDGMATALGWRVAAGLAGPDEEADEEAISAQRDAFLERAGLEEDEVADWLEGLGRDAKWLNEMLALEAAYDRARETLVTDQLCRQELAAVRLQYSQIDLELVELESRDAASEALMCVRSDGLSLAQVAEEGSYPYHRAVMLLEDLPADIHERVLCAAPGEMLEPLPHGDGFQVCRIHGKTEATLDDPEIRGRIEERILGQAFSDLCAQHLRWELPLTQDS